MKKMIMLLALIFGVAVAMKALTYEEAFATVRSLPHMKGVEGNLVLGDNDFAGVGITDGQMIVWSGETGASGETAAYGNALYQIMGELPVAEVVQCKIADGSILVIFAQRLSDKENRILVLSDSAGAGFTGAIIGKINTAKLDALRNAILVPRAGGGTAVYEKVLSF